MCSLKQEEAVELELCRQLAAKSGLPVAMAAILLRRGLRTPEQINAFLHPRLQDLPDPDLMLGVPKAAELTANAMGARQPTVIYADFDVDGLTAGALLYLFLRSAGHRNLHYILPHRLSDGYGVHPHLLEDFTSKIAPGARPLLITVDCGITDIAAVTRAKELGFTVIVTDHHRPSEQLPPADAIVNPWQPGCPFPCKNLAGAGVAFYLLMGLRRHLAAQGFWAKGQQAPNLKEYLDLVAMGTIADMVPLRGVNRILCRAGIEVLATGQRPGICAMLENSDIQKDKGNNSSKIPPGANGNRALFASDISFTLAPRLNAAGRVSHPENAFRLLITENGQEAKVLATELENLNRWRREVSDKIYREATERFYALTGGEGEGEKRGAEEQKIIVLADEKWHLGVLGIAATRLTRDFKRPVILLGRDKGVWKGSGRSVAGLDLLAAVSACEEFLLGYGGHAAALGLSVDEQNLPLFQQAVEIEAGARLATTQGEEETKCDWFFSHGQIEKGITSGYHLLEPFGPGNPEPLFGIRGRLARAELVGRDHLRFKWEQSNLNMPGIAFGDGTRRMEYAQNEVEMIFAIKRNFYQGRCDWQIQAKSIQPIP
mgnify:CR=1 FL=1